MAFDWLIRRKDAIFIDLGFGRYPTTTIETYRRLAGINPDIGVEIDTERLLGAKRYDQSNVEFRLDGFNLPLRKEESATLIRCYRDFQSVLPKNLLHHVIPGEWIYQFFEDWTASYYKIMKQKLPSKRQIFYETALILYKEYGYNLIQTKRLLKRGFLVVK